MKFSKKLIKINKDMRQLPDKFLAAVIAVRALPGAPLYDANDDHVLNQALHDLKLYQKEGVDSVILENDFDLPFIKPPLPPKAINLMTKIAQAIRKEFKKPIGIQMLEGANETSLEISQKADLDFLRVEAYVFAHVGGAGIIEACAGKLLRLRKSLKLEHVKIFADVKKKHCSHSLTMDLDIIDEVKQAEMFFADGFVITGKFTGISPKVDDLKKVKGATKLPVIIGSGMTVDNIKDYFPLADGFIVGSTFRKDSQFLGDTDPQRLHQFMTVFSKLR